MRIKNSVSSTFNIEVEKGEELYMRLGGNKNAMKVVIGETEGKIAFSLQDNPTIRDGGPGVIKGTGNTGKINSYAQIEFNIEPEEED